MQTPGRFVLVTVAVLVLPACEFQRDSVEPGYYGIPQAGSNAMPGSTAPPQGSPGIGTVTSNSGPGSRPAPASASAGKPGSVASERAGAPAQRSPADTGASGSGSGGAMEPATCDLTGRWLATMHLVVDALGELQYTHYFNYFEIDQQGDAFVVEKGLLCGYDSIGLGDFAATANFSAAWFASVAREKYDGWSGTSVKAGGGCQIDSEKWYTVRGATRPHYLDPSIPLPSAEQQATGTTPGWEDWDNDGNPGVTGIISGIVSGKIFVAPRSWLVLSGTAADVSATFKVPTQWNQEQNVMAYDGTPLLGSESVRAADATLHFAQFARLGADQATGDDAAICASIIELAPTLTPEAAGN